MMKIEKDITIIIASIMAGVYASTGFLTQILSQIIASFQGSIMTMLYITVIIVIVIIGILIQKNKYIKYNKSVFVVALLFMMYYSFTSIFLGTPLTDFPFFLVFTIIAFVVPSIIAVNELIFMRTVIYLSVLGLPFINKIFTLDYNNTISMGNSYAFLFPTITTIIYFVYHFRADKWYLKMLDSIALVTNVIYLFMLIAFGSRGPIVCILSYFSYYVIVKETTNSVKIRKVRFALFAIVVIVVLFNFVSVLLYLNNMIESLFGVRLNFFEKFIWMSYVGDMSNGRDSIIDDTIKGIIENPILGHGCDLFYINHSGIYPHNFILQMFYDMGIVVSFVWLVALFKKFMWHIKYNYYKEKYTLIILLLFASVPGALFSNNLWNNVVLWLFFGSIFSKTFSYKANITNNTFENLVNG